MPPDGPEGPKGSSLARGVGKKLWFAFKVLAGAFVGLVAAVLLASLSLLPLGAWSPASAAPAVAYVPNVNFFSVACWTAIASPRSETRTGAPV